MKIQMFHLNAQLLSRSFLDSLSTGSTRRELKLHTNHHEEDKPSGTEQIPRVNTYDGQRDHCANLQIRPLLLLNTGEQTALHEKCLYVQVSDRCI